MSKDFEKFMMNVFPWKAVTLCLLVIANVAGLIALRSILQLFLGLK